MDPFGHPDLERLGRTLRTRLDDTLDAEQSAARSAARRRRTMRDICIEAEDRRADVVIVTVDGHVSRGLIAAVGVDHVVLAGGPAEHHVALAHIITLECR
jgi:predicted nuclease of predicted toxin-antitoxin system